MNSDLACVTLPAGADTASIVDMKNAQGIAVLPGYYSTKTLAGLNKEFDSFLSGAKASGDNALIEREELTALPVVRNQIDPARFPKTAEVFGSQMMRDIAVSYLGTQEIGLNHQIYVNLNHATISPVDQLPFLVHFDKISTFKFFVYLTDTDEKSGAMGMIPGSHIKNRKIRNEALEQEGQIKSIPNVMYAEKLFPVEGVAGTMFIFDTDVSHAAGFVKKKQRAPHHARAHKNGGNAENSWLGPAGGLTVLQR